MPCVVAEFEFFASLSFRNFELTTNSKDNSESTTEFTSDKSFNTEKPSNLSMSQTIDNVWKFFHLQIVFADLMSNEDRNENANAKPRKSIIPEFCSLCITIFFQEIPFITLKFFW